jgi:hypothetical protein
MVFGLALLFGEDLIFNSATNLKLRDRSYDTRMSIPTRSPVTPRDGTDVMVIFSFAAVQFIAYFLLDGS